MTDPRELSRRYDREAQDYRDLWAPVLRQASRRMIATLGGPPARRILDLGCGVGTLFDDLREAFPGAEVVGFDRSPGMLAAAPPALPRAVADAMHLPLGDGSTDLVVCAFMLFHVASPERALREAHRVLRPGGRVATLTWGGHLESAALRAWTESLDEHGADPPDAANAQYELLDTPDKMEAILRAVGFESPRAWTDELTAGYDADRLVHHKTRMGAEKPRFDSLSPDAQAACIAAARRRLAALAPADFVARGSVVCAVATR